VWLLMFETFGHDPLYNPLMYAYIARMPRNLGMCFRRQELIPDEEWYGSHYSETMQRPLGVDAILACFQPIPGRFDEFAEVYLARACGERDFSGRQRLVVQEAFGI